MERRELLQVLAGVGLLPLISACSELIPNPKGNGPGIKQPVQAGTLDQLSQNGQFVLANVATDTSPSYPVVVTALSSASAPAGALAHPTVAGLYLLAFSRVCTHQGTTIDNPAGGKMHCSNHGQDFDTKTGNPTGTANKTTVPLAQFGLEIRNSSEIWAVSVLRDGGSGGGTPSPGGTLQLTAPAKVATLVQVAADGQFVVGSLATSLNAKHPVVVVAAKSASALSGAIPHPTVSGLYILAFSRVCTHSGTTINPPGSGLMHCPNHGQDFDYQTGSPTGSANKTSVPLAQFGLEIRNTTEVWAVSVVRDGGSGGGGGDDD